MGITETKKAMKARQLTKARKQSQSIRDMKKSKKQRSSLIIENMGDSFDKLQEAIRRHNRAAFFWDFNNG